MLKVMGQSPVLDAPFQILGSFAESAAQPGKLAAGWRLRSCSVSASTGELLCTAKSSLAIRSGEQPWALLHSIPLNYLLGSQNSNVCIQEASFWMIKSIFVNKIFRPRLSYYIYDCVLLSHTYL
jgi:hypothetical protein